MSLLEVVGMGAMNLDQLYLVKRILADGEIAVSVSSPKKARDNQELEFVLY